MADSRISDLTAMTVLAAGDLLECLDISDTSMAATGTNHKITLTNFLATLPAPVIITSAAATALSVGPAGNTNPVLRVVANTASQATGLSITGNAAGAGVTLTAISSGANEGFKFVSTGVGSNNYIATFSGGGFNIASINGNIGCLSLASFGALGFCATGNSEQTVDSGIARVAAGVVKFTIDSIGTSGGWHQWAGQSYLASDQTNATANLASTTLSVTLTAGRKYAFKCILYVSDDTAAEGVKIDFGGGTVTATTFRAHVTGFDTALSINTQVTSLTGAASAGTFTGSGMVEIHGSITVNAGGTFIPRFSQNTHAIGTLTLFAGSHLLVWNMP